MDSAKVTFGGKGLALAGVFGGVAIAVAIPLIVLIFGAALPVWLTATVMILSILAGGAIALTAAFFGAVMPKEVNAGDDEEGERKPRKMGVEMEFGLGKDKPKPPETPAPASGDAVPKA